jgi:hypothetical protein
VVAEAEGRPPPGARLEGRWAKPDATAVPLEAEPPVAAALAVRTPVEERPRGAPQLREERRLRGERGPRAESAAIPTRRGSGRSAC